MSTHRTGVCTRLGETNQQHARAGFMSTLTINEASQRCGVSIVTLRRAIKSGSLRTEPRRNDREPYKLLDRDLEAAGFSVAPATIFKPNSITATIENDSSRLLSDLEAVRAEVAALRGERDDLIARAHRAEGELAATRRDFDTLTAGLTPALASLVDRASHVERQILQAEPLRGEVVENAERPIRRRWWHRERTLREPRAS